MHQKRHIFDLVYDPKWGHKLGQTDHKGHLDLWGHKVGHDF